MELKSLPPELDELRNVIIVERRRDRPLREIQGRLDRDI